jgi:hypothetical protein
VLALEQNNLKQMIKVQYIIILILWTNLILGQESDSLGLDNNSLLNRYESTFISNQFEKENIVFDFNNKRIAFYYSLIGFTTKQEYFEESKDWLGKGQNISLQIIILDVSEQKYTGGYDAIIICWNKRNITQKLRLELIEDLKRAST